MSNFVVTVALLCMFGMTAAAQNNQHTTSCNLQDGKQISIRYPSLKVEKNNNPANGDPWPSNQSPVYLFSQADLKIGNSSIPVGAYRIVLIPNKKQWTLIVNRDVSEGSTYDQSKDVAREQMALGRLPEAGNEAQFILGHVAPKQCNLRIYYGKTGAWAEFREQ